MMDSLLSFQPVVPTITYIFDLPSAIEFMQGVELRLF